MVKYEILWNPWRYEYLKTAGRKTGKCILCELVKNSDEESYIIYRGRYSYIALNAYPYNTGHLMIIPYKHVPSLENLERDELMELMELIIKSMRVLREAFNPDGFNIGLNIGRAAGAGIDDHVHIHVVPRWIGDTNFLAVIGSTKNLPLMLHETYQLLKNTWIKIYGERSDK